MLMEIGIMMTQYNRRARETRRFIKWSKLIKKKIILSSYHVLKSITNKLQQWNQITIWFYKIYWIQNIGDIFLIDSNDSMITMIGKIFSQIKNMH